MASDHGNPFTEGSDEEWQEDWTDTGWAQPIDVNHNGSKLQPQQQKRLTCQQGNSSMGLTVTQSNDEGTQDLKTEALQRLSSQTKAGVTRMGLNDNKAGMKGLDKERINQIIFEASKGSRFYENEKKKEEQMKRRIAEQKVRVESLSESQLRQGQIEADKLLEELEAERTLDRHIVHIDMDAFYAAVEMRDEPSLRDKPMAVGGSAMLSTSNYHARRYGVRAAMPGFIGKKLCPDLVIVPTNFEKYTTVSKQVREVLAEYDPNYSTMSLDEAYLDFTDHVRQRPSLEVKGRTFLARTNDHCDKELCVCNPNAVTRDWLLSQESCHVQSLNHGDVVDIDLLLRKISTSDPKISTGLLGELCCHCNRKRPRFKVEVFGESVEEAVREMRFRIEQKTRLTASAGIAPNTMLAKVCSDYNKPNGQFRVQPTFEAVTSFVNSLPIRKVSGIGNVSEKMLHAVGVELCSHLYQKRALLYFLYSAISFNYFMRVCLGLGSTRIERDGERKSLSTERSFREINKPAELYQKCEELCEALWEDLEEEQLMGKTVTLKLKTVGFEVRTRAQTLREYTHSKQVLLEAAREILRGEIQACAPHPLRLRLMGVRMSSLLHVSHYSKQKTIKGMFKQLESKNQPADSSRDPAASSPSALPACSLSAMETSSPIMPGGGNSVMEAGSSDVPLTTSSLPSCTSTVQPSIFPVPLSTSTVSPDIASVPLKKCVSTVPLSPSTVPLMTCSSRKPNMPSFPSSSTVTCTAKASSFQSDNNVMLPSTSDMPVLAYDKSVRCDDMLACHASDSSHQDVPSSIVLTDTPGTSATTGYSVRSGSEQLVKTASPSQAFSVVSSIDASLTPSLDKSDLQQSTSDTSNATDSFAVVTLPPKTIQNELIRDTVSQRTRQKRKYSGQNEPVDCDPSGTHGDNKISLESVKTAYTCPVCQKEVFTNSLNNMNKHVDKCLAKMNKDGGDQRAEADMNVPKDDLTGESFPLSSFIKPATSKETLPALPSLEPSAAMCENLGMDPSTSSDSKEQTTHSCHDNSKGKMSVADHPSSLIGLPCINNGEFVSGEIVHNKDCDTDPHSSGRVVMDVVDLSDDTTRMTANESSQQVENQRSSERSDRSLDVDPSVPQRYSCPVCNIVLYVSLARFNDHVDRCLNQPAISSILKEPNQQAQENRKQKRLSVDQSPPASAAKRKKNSNSPKSRSIMSYLKR